MTLAVVSISFAAILVVLSVSSWASAFAPLSPQAKTKPLTTATTLFADKFKVFIDGEAGTTGIQVRSRIEARDDLEIISPPFDKRKDEETRKQMINEADVVILCLPDAASIEAASFVHADNDRTVIIDASTAFRVDDDWVYGFPGE